MNNQNTNIPLANFLFGTVSGNDDRGVSQSRNTEASTPGRRITIQPILNNNTTLSNNMSTMLEQIVAMIPENTLNPNEERYEEDVLLNDQTIPSCPIVTVDNDYSTIDEIDKATISNKVTSMLSHGDDNIHLTEFDNYILNSNKFQTVQGFKNITSNTNETDFVNYLANPLLKQYPDIKRWLKYIKIITNKTKFINNSIYENFKLNSFSNIVSMDKFELLESSILLNKLCKKASEVLKLKSIYTISRITTYSAYRSPFSDISTVSNNDVFETYLIIQLVPVNDSIFSSSIVFNLMYIKHGFYDNTFSTIINTDVDDVTNSFRIFDATRPIVFTNWRLILGKGEFYNDEDELINPENECIICKSDDKCIAIVPCGHLIACNSCSDMLVKENSNNTCPLCRSKIEGTIKVKMD